MKIAVCVKEVPDMESHFSIAPDRKWIDESGLQFVMNDFDEFAVEEAIRLKEKHGGEVIVVTLGPERVKQTLRKALAMGADRGIHLNDAAFLGGDAYATALALAKSLEGEKPEIIFTGVQTEDDASSQVGVIMAELLGYSHASVVTKVEVDPSRKMVKVHREIEGGDHQVLESSLPVVLTIQTGINEPRYASLPGIMQAKKKPIKNVSVADLGLSPSAVGYAGSLVQTVELLVPKVEHHAQMLSGAPQEVAKQLVIKLKEEVKVL
ncbi:MAG: electron transfer flavoprotein subunit beta/FixA family protein [Deltaproteobacteria bacterium]|nr:electron transfer flavoprotein subunit beta/FixA family protein [Deltaproteobacteria bacterium]